MPLIKAIDLCKEYVNDEVVTPVLHKMSFQIEEGEFVAIMGPSGSGKSTLMHILSFLDKSSCGKYFFKEKDVSELSDDQLAQMRSKEVGFVFQSFNLLPRTTVLENVMLPLLYDGVSNSNIRAYKAKQALVSVGLEHRLDYYTSQLSGGEKQRVAIARSLVNNPSIIFADEPTGNLDSKSGQIIMEILENLNEKGHTVILVTHEQDTARHAKRILKMRDGLLESDINVSDRRSAKDGELMK